MNADDLVGAASEATGLSDLGPDADVVRAGLAAYLSACASEAELSELGVLAVQGAVVGALTNRLRVVEHHRQNPALADSDVGSPVVVVGLFRAGTTLLSNLFDRDPANRVMLRWESGDSVPPPSPTELRAGDRVDAGQVGVDMLAAINPAIKAIHHEDSSSPTECIAVLGQAFQSISWEALANVPSYAEWWRASDMTAGYRYHRSVLQVLQSNGCAGRWMLKSPGHALALDALTAVYPDARLVVLHRDPVVLTASVCSLIGTMSGSFSDADHRDYLRTHWTQTLEDCISAVDAHADRLHHVQYAELVTDPLGTVERLYDELGLEPGAGAFDAMAAELAARPKGVFGKHSYDLASYGLVEAELRERFGDYVDRYHVPHEAPSA